MSIRLLGKADDVQPPTTSPAVLLVDIETTPILGYTWDMYKADVLRVEKLSEMLCFAYKWLDQDEVHWVGRNQFKRRDDREVVARLWNLFDKADVVVAHNGDRFDIKKAVARFMVHGFPPHSEFASIDTLKEVRRYAKFGSHRLNNLGASLGVGTKAAHSGLHTWFGCMADDPDAWEVMERYNRQDVVLLEEVYRELLPWIGSPRKANPGVNAAAYSDGVTCPKVGCGSTKPPMLNGWMITAAGLRYRRYKCRDCRGHSRARYAERESPRQPAK